MTHSAWLRQLAISLLLLGLLAPMLAVAPAAAQTILPQATAEAEEAPAPQLSAEQTQAIAELLRDEAAREALITELERLAAGRTAAAEDAPPEGGEPVETAAEEQDSLGRRIAQDTQEIAQFLAGRALALWNQLEDAKGAFSGLAAIDAGLFFEALIDLALVIAATVILFLGLRLLVLPLYRWMGRKARPMGFLGTALVWLASVIVDALIVLVAWAVGYALAVLVFGTIGEIGIRQSLYLNAFLMVEMVKVAIRAVLSPSVGELRPVHIPDCGARTLWRTLDIAVSLIGYGQFLIVPIVNSELGYYSGRSVSAALLLIAMVVLAVASLRHRRAVAGWLAGEPSGAIRRPGVLSGLVRLWYVPVFAYLAAIFVIVATRPGDVLLPVLWASGKVLIASVAGWLIAGLLGRAMAHGIRLPGSVNQRLPLLERRLNAFVPRALFVLRLVILFAVISYTLDALGLADVGGWFDSDAGVVVTTTLLTVVIVLLLSFALWLALSSWVEYRLNPEWGSVPTARESTLLSLLRNAATVALIVITLMFVLSEIGIDIAPLIASAGVIGLAIGFGAQKLVQDIITGIFIQLENAMNVGDVVAVAGTSGVVERLTVRSVSLRDLEGAYHIIPFSSVDMVSNFMREFAFVVADVGIAYRESVDDAKQAMFDAFERLKEDPAVGPSIIGDLQWFGVNSFGESSVDLRARIKTLPGQQWGVGRAYNEVIKRVFDERSIEIPFPHRTLYFGESKEGEAPKAHIAISSRPPESVRQG